MRRLILCFALLPILGCERIWSTIEEGAVAGYPSGTGYSYVVLRSQAAWSVMHFWNNAAAAPGSLPAVDFANDLVVVGISEPKPGPGFALHVASVEWAGWDTTVTVAQDGPSGTGAVTRPYACARLTSTGNGVRFRRTGAPDAMGEEKTYQQLINMDYALRGEFPPVTDEATIYMLNSGAAPGTGETLVEAQLPGWLDNEETACLAPSLGTYWISERYFDGEQGAFVKLWYGPFRPGVY
ncbi:MAG: hypothetical protein HYY16_03065 [Planctomycetes bacterium]|nr:hypothetical protein [Planctomycetota bacterium]